MRSYFITVISSIAAVFIIGCGGSKTLQSSLPCDPEWFNNIPSDPNTLFAAKTETSQDYQLAIDKATLSARTEIGNQVDLKLTALEKNFKEETGTGEDAQFLSMMTQAKKSVLSTSLQGSRVKSVEKCKDGNIWRAYALVEYPLGAAREAYLQQLKKNEQMYTRFRATQTFKELDEEVKKYDDYKKSQGQ